MVTTYTYDAANRMTKVGNTNYTWDNDGNLTNDGGNLYRYDQANRLISTTLATTTTLFYYNGDGVRLKQVISSVPTTYTQDLAALLPVVLQGTTGTTTTRYLYSVNTRPVAQYTSNAFQYLLPDALGSVRQIVDASGNVLLNESYEPYGKLLNSSGSGTSIFGYAGEQFDTTGLIYLRARYMNPMLGIFTSRDPWSGDGMRPRSMNGWGYVEGNPINKNDPSGRFDAVDLARTYGFTSDIAGMVDLISRLSDNWGWAALLLDAQPGDVVNNYSNLRRENWGTFKIQDGIIKLEIDPMLSNDRDWHNIQGGAESGNIPRPSPQNLRWWRRKGAYALLGLHAPSFYINKGDSGNITDLPDFQMISEGGLSASAGGLLDRYGNFYLSGAWTPGLGAGVAFGEGYVGKGNLFAGYGQMIDSEEELSKAMQGVALGVSAALGAGGQASFTICTSDFFNFSGPCYATMIYSIGMNGSLGGSVGGSIKLQAKDPRFAWDWMIQAPGPTRDQIIDRIVQSYIKEPCGQYTQ